MDIHILSSMTRERLIPCLAAQLGYQMHKTQQLGQVEGNVFVIVRLLSKHKLVSLLYIGHVGKDMITSPSKPIPRFQFTPFAPLSNMIFPYIGQFQISARWPQQHTGVPSQKVVQEQVRQAHDFATYICVNHIPFLSIQFMFIFLMSKKIKGLIPPYLSRLSP